MIAFGLIATAAFASQALAQQQPRNPIGVGRVKGQLFIVDDRGTVIDDYGPKYGDLDLPIIDGLAAPTAVPSETNEQRGALAARLILALRAKPTLARRVSQIDVSDLHNAAVIVTGDPALIYLGEDRFAQRVVAGGHLIGIARRADASRVSAFWKTSTASA